MKTFKSYFIPSLIAAVFMSTYVIIDGMFIGAKLSDIGLSAINLAWPITSILQSVGMSLGISSGIYISRLKALKEKEKSEGVMYTSILILFFSSIILGTFLFLIKKELLVQFQAKNETLNMAIEYLSIILAGSSFQVLGCGLIPLLRNNEKVKTAAAASIISVFTNFLLDYILIIFFDYGLFGAAVASVISQGVALIICLIPFFKKKITIYYSKNVFKEILLGALAPLILNYSYSIIIILTNALCIKYEGDAAVAAYTVLSYILYIINAISQGSADSIQPLFSFHYERNEYKITHKLLFKILIINFTICFFIIIFLLIIHQQIISLYGLSDTAKVYFLDGMKYYFIAFVFISISKVICSYLYSINKKVYANILILVEPIILTPLIYLILSSLKLNGLWIGYLVIQIILLIISILFLFLVKKYEGENNGRIYTTR
ncbi:MAG: MATE family efflux transporter [Anaeroplasma sp.]